MFDMGPQALIVDRVQRDDFSYGGVRVHCVLKC